MSGRRVAFRSPRLHASLQKIADRAGVTHAGVLRYFRSKAQLLTSVLALRDETDIEQTACPRHRGPRGCVRTRRAPGLLEPRRRGQRDHRRHGRPQDPAAARPRLRRHGRLHRPRCRPATMTTPRQQREGVSAVWIRRPFPSHGDGKGMPRSRTGQEPIHPGLQPHCIRRRRVRAGD
ncbi:helix-turn-helix domain-containing protein [Streptomyces sp. NPDC005065]